jgi:hypothetical protein
LLASTWFSIGCTTHHPVGPVLAVLPAVCNYSHCCLLWFEVYFNHSKVMYSICEGMHTVWLFL